MSLVSFVFVLSQQLRFLSYAQQIGSFFAVRSDCSVCFRSFRLQRISHFVQIAAFSQSSSRACVFVTFVVPVRNVCSSSCVFVMFVFPIRWFGRLVVSRSSSCLLQFRGFSLFAAFAFRFNRLFFVRLLYFRQSLQLQKSSGLRRYRHLFVGNILSHRRRFVCGRCRFTAVFSYRARFYRSSRQVSSFIASFIAPVRRSACLRRWSLSFGLSCRRSSFMLALGSNQLRDIRGRSMCRDQEIRMCIK